MTTSRTIALEEHVQFPDLVERIDPALVEAQGKPSGAGKTDDLGETGEKRIAAMDAAGIDVQILSCSPPGADLLDGEERIKLQGGNAARLLRL